MQTYHKWDADGKHYEATYDECYETRGSYGLDTEEETKAAEDEEIAKLDSGEWTVVSIVVREPCRGKDHCEACVGTTIADSISGVVIENSHEAVEEYAADCM